MRCTWQKVIFGVGNRAGAKGKLERWHRSRSTRPFSFCGGGRQYVELFCGGFGAVSDVVILPGCYTSDIKYNFMVI